MSALISAFGIDWRLLVINIVNFGVLLFALWYFLYGPLLRMLDSRRDMITKGVADAEAAAHALARVESEKSEVLAQAARQADDLLAHARKAGSLKEQELLIAGEEAAARLTKAAEAQALEIKARALAESRDEVATLIVLGAEKILKEKA